MGSRLRGNDTYSDFKNSMSWSITLIKICGFPKYSCGHTYLLLAGKIRQNGILQDVIMLSHVKLQPSENKPLSGYQYWSNYFFTNQLRATVVNFTTMPEIQKMLSYCKSALSCECKMWMINDKAGEAVYQKILTQSQETLGPFLLYGRSYGHFFGEGTNCKEWAQSMLSMAGVRGKGCTLDIADLLELLMLNNSKNPLFLDGRGLG